MYGVYAGGLEDLSSAKEPRIFVCIADLRSCKYNEQLLKTAKNKIPLVRLFFMSVPKIPCGFCGGKNIKTLDG